MEKINSPLRHQVTPEVRILLEMLALALRSGELEPMSALEQVWDIGVGHGRILGVREATNIIKEAA
jgi:hypothetical protein